MINPPPPVQCTVLKKSKRGTYVRKVKVKSEKIIAPKTTTQVDMGKVKEFNKKTNPIDVEQIKILVNSRKPVDRVYESAFSDKRDALRPPAKYSNRKAIDDYDNY